MLGSCHVMIISWIVVMAGPRTCSGHIMGESMSWDNHVMFMLCSGHTTIQ